MLPIAYEWLMHQPILNFDDANALHIYLQLYSI